MAYSKRAAKCKSLANQNWHAVISQVQVINPGTDGSIWQDRARQDRRSELGSGEPDHSLRRDDVESSLLNVIVTEKS